MKSLRPGIQWSDWRNSGTCPIPSFSLQITGQVVGGMAFATQKDKVIHLHQLYVHPKYHGGKTGLHLMIEIENSFIDAETIRLEVEAKNENAIRFYEAYGFQACWRDRELRAGRLRNSCADNGKSDPLRGRLTGIQKRDAIASLRMSRSGVFHLFEHTTFLEVLCQQVIKNRAILVAI